MSKKIHLPFVGNPNGGGPHIFCYKFAQALSKRGFTILYDKPQRSDVVLCIVSVGKIFKKVNRDKTRIVLRTNGIYNDLYNKKFNRAIRPDMVSLHNDLKKAIPLLDHCVYQSKWSFDRIEDEIVKRPNNYSIIHNGCDTNLFKPIQRKNDGIIKLIHCGKMRDSYLMEMLIGTYLEVKKNHNVQLLLIGGMDAGCAGVYNNHSTDKGIIKLGAFSNTKLTQAYSQGDIFLDVRQGCSSNNTVAEAQACGLPVIASSWGGDCEMIVDKQTGIIVDGGKWDYNQNYIQKLAQGVEQIIPDLDRFKLRARQHAKKELSIDKMVDKYLKAMVL